MTHQHELPLLAGIAGAIRWVEELANLIAGPLLTLGLGIALIDLLTDGSLLTHAPFLLYAWAISQAVGVDAQLVATWDRARIALRERRLWALLGLLVLGAVLAYVAWVAAQVFALQESEGVTTAQALARLGFDSAIWLIQRTALAVFLVCLSGWTRYHPPVANVAEEAQAERARLEAELLLEPLRAQKRAMQARGLRSVVAAAAGRETPTGPSRPPTGPGSPQQKQPAAAGVITPVPNVVRMARPSRRRPAARNRVSVEARARRAYRPGMSASELARTAHIGKSAASKYRSLFAAEEASMSDQQAVQ